ncbi:MAG: hypothetical protein ACKER6_00735 [Candidatus Hodgkinia cicadicola]
MSIASHGRSIIVECANFGKQSDLASLRNYFKPRAPDVSQSLERGKRPWLCKGEPLCVMGQVSNQRRNHEAVHLILALLRAEALQRSQNIGRTLTFGDQPRVHQINASFVAPSTSECLTT